MVNLISIFTIFVSYLMNSKKFQALFTGVIDFIRLFICLMITMNYIFMLCVFGDETTTKFEKMYGSICKCSWYEFPIETQKVLPLVLRTAQQPVHLRGYMNVRCTREFMKAVSYLTFVFVVFNDSIGNRFNR